MEDIKSRQTYKNDLGHVKSRDDAKPTFYHGEAKPCTHVVTSIELAPVCEGWSVLTSSPVSTKHVSLYISHDFRVYVEGFCFILFVHLLRQALFSILYKSNGPKAFGGLHLAA